VRKLPRDLPIANDHYLIMFDRSYQIADIYYPHIGLKNHALGHPFRFGVFVEGRFSWTASWDKVMKYSGDTLVTDVSMRNDDVGLKLHCSDCVDFVSPIYIKQVDITDITGRQREIRLFFAHDFHLNETGIGDTAYYDASKTRALIHYKTDSYFLMNCLTPRGEGIFEYACGLKETGNNLGTWKDAEDGFLSGNPIAQGSVDSVISARFDLPAGGSSTLHYWMVAGSKYEEVERRNSFVLTRTPQKLLKRTADFWRLWSIRYDVDRTDLDDSMWKLFNRSLLTVRSQTDGNGAIIAANDTDTLKFNKDTYSYMWPRDGSFVTMALDDAGYHIIAHRFFDFCSKVILPQGWFFHKYQPDGSLGSSWHPWIFQNRPSLPIQEDQTALVIVTLWNHFSHSKDVDFVEPFYKAIAKDAGSFLLQYRDAETGLPRESYDLWEERRGVFTYTSCAVYAGLVCASNFARAFGEDEYADSFTTAANEMKNAILENLYDPNLGRFIRGCQIEDGEVTDKDTTIDSSLVGVFLFGLLPADDPRVAGTMKQIEDRLTVKTRIGGIARYQNDKYQALGNYGSGIPGNPWFVCTLWVADWYIEKAKARADLARARDLLAWATSNALPSGIMAEQLNPYDGSPLSVSPLTWSHGAYADTVMRYLRKYSSLKS
jgi:glucoamylase